MWIRSLNTVIHLRITQENCKQYISEIQVSIANKIEQYEKEWATDSNSFPNACDVWRTTLCKKLILATQLSFLVPFTSILRVYSYPPTRNILLVSANRQRMFLMPFTSTLIRDPNIYNESWCNFHIINKDSPFELYLSFDYFSF